MTANAAAARRSSSRLTSRWADAKPFPEAPLPSKTVQIWPVDQLINHPSAEGIAPKLYAAMQRQAFCAGKCVLAKRIELAIYPSVCSELEWPLSPWFGKKGVATSRYRQ